MTNQQPDKYRELLSQAESLATQGQWQAAEDVCNQIISFDPDQPAAWYLLGLIHQNTGQSDAAIAAYKKVGKSPYYADALNNVGLMLESAGDTGNARKYFEQATRSNPSHVISNYNLGRLLRTSGNPVAAIPFLETSARNSPGSIPVLLELGLSYKSLGRYPDAAKHIEHALELNHENPGAHNILGNIFQLEGKLEAAASCYRTAIKLQPDFAEAYNNLGSTCLAAGNITAALENYRKALAGKPGWQGAISNILLTENYICEDQEYLFTQHRILCESFPGPVRIDAKPHEKASNTRIRIGYVSPDFRIHSVAWFLNAHFANYDPSAFAIIAFSDTIAPDTVTEKIKKQATEWHNITGMSDPDVYTLIRDSNIDILVDLAGHTANNRLAVFSMQPAAMQLSYLGYPNTTGIKAIQYRVSDAWADPPGESDQWHTEKIKRLAGGFLCYTPPDGCPDVSGPPVKSCNAITYGSFNVLAKISDHCLQSWCAILEQVPDARLLLKSAGLQDETARTNLLNRFTAHGIDKTRIELLPRTSDFHSHMLQYSKVDISLDTFPYNGTTTSCESLWMGVPVVTLAGSRHASRVGSSLLNQLNLDHMIAHDAKQYVSIAKELARDTDQLEGLRSSLRDIMGSSRLCDGRRFSFELESAYKDILNAQD